MHEIMRSSKTSILRLVGFLIGCISAAAAESPRQTVLLDGDWQFQLDPNDLGAKEGWFAEGRQLAHFAKVPGAWDAQGFGPETEKMRHNFIGKGWYKRRIQIPSSDSKEQRYFLVFGGVYRSARVWVNGEEVGKHLGYVSDFEFEITKLARAGEYASITIEIDSEQHWDVDALQGCLDIPDHLFSYWGGIWGHVKLESRNSEWLEHLQIQTLVSPRSCQATATLGGAYRPGDKLRLEIMETDGKIVLTREEPLDALLSNGQATLSADLPDALLWSPESPNLYRARLILLRQQQPLDSQEGTFGIRSIVIQGSHFIVNGNRYYLNGYGDDAVYPQTIAPPSDKAFYVSRLKVAKTYGFNFVRHHSHFLPPEYYEACDEVGMFVSPELPIAYMRYYSRAKGPARELYKTEWANAIVRHRNHPSIFDWCMGNELWDGIDLAPDLYAIAKKLDPSRLVIDSDGLMPSGFTDGQRDRATMDFYTVMFNILTTPLEDPRKFETGMPSKPIMTHEEGNFVQFPRLDSIELYKDDFKPFWLTAARDKIEKFGLLDETTRWSEASEKLYYICHKANLEALRKNPQISGYDWWLLEPWYPGSNGLLDVYRRPISVTPAQVREINGPVVVLQDGIDNNYRGEQRLRASFSVSNYSPAALRSIAFNWHLRNSTSTLSEDHWVIDAAGQGEISQGGKIDVQLPDTLVPEKLTLSVELTAGGLTVTNHWETWLFPAKESELKHAVPLYASDDLLAELEAYHPKAIPSTGMLEPRAVYVARQPTDRLLSASADGACVILLSPVGLFPTDVTTFKSAWWLGVFPGDTNAGTLVYDSPVTRAMAPDGWCDAGWFRLLQGAQTIILDDLVAQPHVLIRALNVHGAPAPFSRGLDFDYVWRNKSLLFEARVEKGSWIVSGLNFDAALRNGGPEARWLLTQMLAYAETLPRPDAALPLGWLRSAIAGSLFSQGPLVSGFSRLLEYKGESVSGVTYRNGDGECLRIRQEEPLHQLSWETAVTPDVQRTTFVFAGGFAFIDPSESKHGFALWINGSKALDFDTTREPTEWKSSNGEILLRYVPQLSQSSWSETMGLFYLSVPASSLLSGKAATITVHSIGQDNKRWFAINPYPDILGSETSSPKSRDSKTDGQ